MFFLFGILVVGFFAVIAGAIVRESYEPEWKAALVCIAGSLVFGVIVASGSGMTREEDGTEVETSEFSAMSKKQQEREQISAFWKGTAVAGVGSLCGALVDWTPLIKRMNKRKGA